MHAPMLALQHGSFKMLEAKGVGRMDTITQTRGRVGGLQFAQAGGRNKRERSLFLVKNKDISDRPPGTPLFIRVMGRARAV